MKIKYHFFILAILLVVLLVWLVGSQNRKINAIEQEIKVRKHVPVTQH